MTGRPASRLQRDTLDAESQAEHDHRSKWDREPERQTRIM